MAGCLARGNSLVLQSTLCYRLSMQTRVFQLKLRTLNRGKASRLESMQQAFTDAVRLHLDTAHTLPQPAVNSLHAACYREACARFALPASTIQQARDQA
jgi:hypothetical protein